MGWYKSFKLALGPASQGIDLSHQKGGNKKSLIQRGGKSIVSMKSIDEKVNPVRLGELKTLLKNLPRLDEEMEAFASDLEEIASKSVADVNGGFMGVIFDTSLLKYRGIKN